MGKPIPRRPLLLLAGILALSAMSTPAFSQASLLVWPIDPVIEADRGAGALWLENKGPTAAVVQIRIFAWSQQNGEDAFSEQSLVVASPPMAQIAPGDRQLVRLISLPGSRTAAETAYRIVVDEIPARLPAAPVGGDGSPGKAGVRFQMRYTIPLFVYSRPRPAPSSASADTGLRCTFAEQGGLRSLTIRNGRAMHVRLIDLQLDDADGSISVPDGQLGYVLAGAARRWSLPGGFDGRPVVSVLVDGSAARTRLPDCAHE